MKAPYINDINKYTVHSILQIMSPVFQMWQSLGNSKTQGFKDSLEQT